MGTWGAPGCEIIWGGGSKGSASMGLNATRREGNKPGGRCLDCPTLSMASSELGTWGRDMGQAGALVPHSSCLCRFIKSERSIILLNFCVSILASNILILVGQSQMLSKVGATTLSPLGRSPGWVRALSSRPVTSALLAPSSRLDLD